MSNSNYYYAGNTNRLMCKQCAEIEEKIGAIHNNRIFVLCLKQI